MKKVLLGSTALLLSAGIAAADVAVSGSGRMGVIDDFGDFSDAGFTSRIRIVFSASGETDGGLSFGGSIRADNAGGGNSGTAGSVFVEGAFGKISMGDVSGAPEAAAGDLSGVGLTGLGDYNELTYLSNFGATARSAMRYDYVTGGLGLHFSANDPENDGTSDDDGSAYGVAVTYSTGGLSVGLGFEDVEIIVPTGTSSPNTLAGVVIDGLGVDGDHVVGSVSYAFGDASVKAAYGSADLETDIPGDIDFTQMGLSVDYVIGATTVTAFYINRELEGTVVADEDVMGLGVGYDLGGGASLVAGYANVDVDGSDSEDAFDFGLNMSF